MTDKTRAGKPKKKPAPKRLNQKKLVERLLSDEYQRRHVVANGLASTCVFNYILLVAQNYRGKASVTAEIFSGLGTLQEEARRHREWLAQEFPEVSPNYR